jgi:hypothetical protein
MVNILVRKVLEGIVWKNYRYLISPTWLYNERHFIPISKKTVDIFETISNVFVQLELLRVEGSALSTAATFWEFALIIDQWITNPPGNAD